MGQKTYDQLSNISKRLNYPTDITHYSVNHPGVSKASFSQTPPSHNNVPSFTLVLHISNSSFLPNLHNYFKTQPTKVILTFTRYADNEDLVVLQVETEGNLAIEQLIVYSHSSSTLIAIVEEVLNTGSKVSKIIIDQVAQASKDSFNIFSQSLNAKNLYHDEGVRKHYNEVQHAVLKALHAIYNTGAFYFFYVLQQAIGGRLALSLNHIYSSAGGFTVYEQYEISNSAKEETFQLFLNNAIKILISTHGWDQNWICLSLYFREFGHLMFAYQLDAFSVTVEYYSSHDRNFRPVKRIVVKELSTIKLKTDKFAQQLASTQMPKLAEVVTTLFLPEDSRKIAAALSKSKVSNFELNLPFLS